MKISFNNQKKQNIKAFSLVEISIVVLILGLLIAGISKASDMIADSQLKSARSLTNGSKAGRTSGLILWLETTKTESLKDSERFDANTITEWKDITPPAIPKVIFKSKGSTSTITYKEASFNNLPGIKFAASTDFMYSYDPKAAESSSADSNNKNIYTSQSNVLFNDGTLTVFAVVLPKNSFQVFSYCAIAVAVTSPYGITEGCANYSKIKLAFNASGNILFDYANVQYNPTTAITNKSPILISIIKNSSNTQYIKVNGGNSLALTSNPVVPVSADLVLSSYAGSFRIGGGAADGEIYELIFFNTALNDSDRYKIESYLATKYKINVKQSVL